MGVGLQLNVLDVSDPTAPREVGGSAPLSGFVQNVAVSGTVGYVAAGGGGLRVVDVSNPARPAVIGSLQTRGYAEGVAVSGTTVCLADGPYGLRVIDVSNPSNPAEIGSAFRRNYAFKVAMAGHYAYVAAAGASLPIVDLTNPAKPVQVATFAAPGYAYGLAVSGDTPGYGANPQRGEPNTTGSSCPILKGGWAVGRTSAVTQNRPMRSSAPWEASAKLRGLCIQAAILSERRKNYTICSSKQKRRTIPRCRL